MNDLEPEPKYRIPLPYWGKVLILVLAVAFILGIVGYMIYLEAR